MLKRIIFAGVIVLALVLGVSVAVASERQPESALRQQEDAQAWLGIGIQDSDNGVTVTEIVPGSPAEGVGLAIGDVIEAVDDTEITSADQLVETVQAYAPGDEVTLTVSTNGASREVAVTLGERPTELTAPNLPGGGPGSMVGMLNFLGLEAQITDEGLEIQAIDEDSPLVDSGLQEGDIITEINGETITDLFPRDLMQALMSGDTLQLTVLRDGEEIQVELDLSALDLPSMPMEPGAGPQFWNGPMMQPPTRLGVRFAPITPELAEEEELSVSEGALIVEVFDDTPAAEAGLQEDDIVTAVNGEAVDEEHTLLDRLAAYEDGDTVTLSILRGDEELELEVTLGPGEPMMFCFPMMEGQQGFQGMMPFFFGPDGDFFEMHPFMEPGGNDKPAPEAVPQEVPSEQGTSA